MRYESSVWVVDRERGDLEGIRGEPLLRARLLEGVLPRPGREPRRARYRAATIPSRTTPHQAKVRSLHFVEFHSGNVG